jgi:hypothetical protein
MQFERAVIDHIGERLIVVGDDVVDVFGHRLGFNAYDFDELGMLILEIFLIKALTIDAIGVSLHHERPIFEVGQDVGRDRRVVINQITLSYFEFWPVELGLMRGLPDFFCHISCYSGPSRLCLDVAYPRELLWRLHKTTTFVLLEADHFLKCDA